MKILVAEDEPDIRTTYMAALNDNGHEVIVAENGEECLDIYRNELKRMKTVADNSYTDDNKRQENTPLSSSFDVVVLDYKMPKKDGMEVAEEILDLNPDQRIIFASAYVRDTLENSVKRLKRVVELLQKPFSPSILVDTIEDREAYEGLKRLMTDVKKITRDKTADFSRDQVRSLFDDLRKIQKGRSFTHFFLSGLTIILYSESLVQFLLI